MVNITVYQTGEVMGDNGKIIGYEGQTYSERINIVHPVFNGAEYYIEYKYNQTIFRDKLDSYNRVKLKLEKAGYLTCQLIAIDILTGNILFKSNTWRFLVEQGLKLEASHYPCYSFINGPHVPHNPCNHSNYSHSHNSCNCNNNDNNIDSYKAYYDLLTELRNEEEIRYKEMQNIYEEIRSIKAALNINNPTSSILNANEVIESGSYIASIRSINFPSNEQEYVLTVSVFDDTVLQEAHETDGDNIWYRTGTIINDNINWTDWAQKITRVQEI